MSGGSQQPPPRPKPKRVALSKKLQVLLFRRDGRLCRWCRRPVIFAPAMKYLARFMQEQGHRGLLAYWSSAYRRDASPLLDELAAAVDHVTAFSAGGAHDESNFVTACYKCNTRKSASSSDAFHKRNPPRPPVMGMYGEPKAWDGFSALFIVLARQNRSELTRSEADWLEALELPAEPDPQHSDVGLSSGEYGGEIP